MSHDFAKKPKAGKSKNARTKKPQPKSQVPGWVWLFTGIVTGIFICFLAYLAGIPLQPSVQPAKSAESQKTAPAPPSKTATRFDFYTLLPEREVIVPDPQSPHQEVNTPEPAIIYILQAGSFKNPSDADRLRAQLILMGLDTQVEAVTANSETWHRVQVGPFSSRSKLSKARNLLINEGIETLLLKRKANS